MAETITADSPEILKVTKLFEKLSTVAASDARVSTAEEVVGAIQAGGVRALKSYGVVEQLKAALSDKKNAGAREGALQVYRAIFEKIGKPAEPFVLPLLPLVLEQCADAKSAPVRAAADAAVSTFANNLCPYAVKAALPFLFEGMVANKWQTKEASYKALTTLAKVAPQAVAACLSEIVPKVTDGMVDAREQVKIAAINSMSACMKVNGNRDIDQFIPSLVQCIVKPAEVPECVHKLAATTFVQQVESPCLSIVVPLLVRGLREPATAIKRKTALIIENLAKLVDYPHDAVPFLPRLIPGLEKVQSEVADPECADVAGKALKTLLFIQEEAKNTGDRTLEQSTVLATLSQLVKSQAEVDDVIVTILDYVSLVCSQLASTKNFDFDEWNNQCVAPYLSVFLSEEAAESICRAFLARCMEDVEKKAKGAADEDDEGEDLCNCEFSLAYGAKILLSNTRLHLKRGRRYGLCGPNGVGKSTLMRAIANGQVEGFPPADELRTVYVEHDIQASLAELPVVEFVVEDATMKNVAREEIVRVLGSVGFNEQMRQSSVSSLSGGWKMKLALARAMLMNADILLLDEPTNHLDVTNVAWLEQYLISLTHVTSILVSHDSGFLDHVCSDIIHYEGRKLKNYRGNLSKFVEIKPEAKSYYTLEDATYKFKFPEPGFLEGVKTKERAILKMAGVGFQYPGSDRKQLTGVTIALSLASRVAVIGANGAGKSTMIKLLTGELEPQEGTVWKHPNLRMAYVAQHAFHHIESHLDKTPSQYIQWRYATGEDREEQTKVSRQINEEEEKKMAAVHVVDGLKRKLEKVLGRRKLKKSYEYEVEWVGSTPDQNSWLTRDQLEEMGFGKMVNEIDAKEAARMGLYTRPLTAVNIEKHMKDFGLEPEFTSHAHIRGLSGGQKVKLVLGAAMWNNPHMLILDEPTNYLDRDSLGAMAAAIKEFGGGVVMISHHSEFTTALCPEAWVVADGRLALQGASTTAGETTKIELKLEEETTDAFGNKIKIKAPPKKLSRKEQKAREKLRKARRERGEEVSESEEEL